MAWIGAAIAAGAAIYGANKSSSGQAGANQMNYLINKEQMQFQERMSNTAYQRAVNDMSKAGLNPALAYSQGGASSPAGSSAHMENPDAAYGNFGRDIASAVQLSMIKAQKENIEADTTLKTSTAAQAEANVALLRTTKERVGAEYDKIRQEVANLRTENDLRQFDRDKLKPLEAVYKEYINKQTALQIPVMEADAKFWEMVQKEGGVTAKALMFLKQLIK